MFKIAYHVYIQYSVGNMHKHILDIVNINSVDIMHILWNI